MPDTQGLAGKAGRSQTFGIDHNPQFFVQLADERRLGAFSDLDLAAGKLPKICEIAAGRPLLDEDAPVMIDQSSGHDHGQ